MNANDFRTLVSTHKNFIKIEIYNYVYMKKDVKIIKDVEVIRIGVEETRNKIAALLKVEDMTISQLAEALNKDQSTIYRHIKKLEEAGFVEVCGERKIHHIPEKLYGRTAGIFLFSPVHDEVEDGVLGVPLWEIEQTRWILNTLSVLGSEIDITDEKIEEVSNIFSKLSRKTERRIMRAGDKISDISWTRLLRLSFIIFLIEMENDLDLKERVGEILSDLY